MKKMFQGKDRESESYLGKASKKLVYKKSTEPCRLTTNKAKVVILIAKI